MPLTKKIVIFPYHPSFYNFSLISRNEIFLLVHEDDSLNILLSHQCSIRHNSKIHRRRELIGHFSQKCRESAISFEIIHKNFASKSTIARIVFQLVKLGNQNCLLLYFFFSSPCFAADISRSVEEKLTWNGVFYDFREATFLQ